MAILFRNFLAVVTLLDLLQTAPLRRERMG
jgi:hypothetical protein